MDIIRFTKVGVEKTLLKQGEIVNGLTSKMWVERYREPGEFKFVAPLSSFAQIVLPVGTLISHTNTLEVMQVENHEIAYNKDQDPDIVISGRSWETFLENRVVGKGSFANQGGYNKPYDLTSAAVGVSALAAGLIHDTTDPAANFHPDLNDEIHYISPAVHLEDASFEGGDFDDIVMSYKRGDMHSQLLDILAIDNLGIRTERPHPARVVLSTVYANDPVTDTTFFIVHNGKVRYQTVAFEHEAGDIESADYLWSNRKVKSEAVVTSTWLELNVRTAAHTGYQRRALPVDATSIDSHLTTPPTGATLTDIQNKMIARGKSVLGKQKQLHIARVEISKDAMRHKYRSDYNMGDLVGVRGQFGTFEVMRVIEHVEIEDENGEQAYPSLAADE